MSEKISRPPRIVWFGFSFLFALLGVPYAIWLVQTLQHPPLPLRVIGPVALFTLTNQDAQVVSLADFTNHVWVADIVFTRCAGPCPRLTAQMKSLQEKLPVEYPTRLVTLTTDPEFDTPEVLKKYGQHFGADFKRWTFLTGSKSEIATLASGSLKLSAQPVKPEERRNDADLFIHATIMVVVDKHAQLRGFFETGGDGVDWTNSVQPKLLQAVRQLESEP